MNIRTSLVPLVVLLTGLGGTFAAAVAGETAVVDAREPLAVTLLPTVTVTADPANPDGPTRWSVEKVAPLPVTLMPTVHVTARPEPLAMTVLPTVHVVAKADPQPDEGLAAAHLIDGDVPYEALPRPSDFRQDLRVWLSR